MMNIRARERDRSLGDENQLPHHLAPEAHRRHRQGEHQIRFCQYSSKGSFVRPPLIIDEKDLSILRKAVRHCPELHALPKQLV